MNDNYQKMYINIWYDYFYENVNCKICFTTLTPPTDKQAISTNGHLWNLSRFQSHLVGKFEKFATERNIFEKKIENQFIVYLLCMKMLFSVLQTHNLTTTVFKLASIFGEISHAFETQDWVTLLVIWTRIIQPTHSVMFDF